MPTKVFGPIVMIAFAALTGVAVSQQHAVTRLDAVIRQHEPRILRQRTIDRLAGKRLTPSQQAWLDSIAPTAGPSVYRLVWFVDPDRCPGCLSRVGTWNEVSRQGAASTWLIVENADPDEVRAVVERAGIQGNHAAVPDATGSSLFGFGTPSTRLVIRGGIIILADARFPNQTCSWTAEDVVAQFTGLD